MESKYYREHFWGVSQIQAVYQEREAQIGVDTSNGYFLSEDPSLLFEGNRTHEICFTTGDDITSEQRLLTTINGTGAHLQVYIYNNKLSLFAGSSAGIIGTLTPNTMYHLVVTMDITNTKACSYLNGTLTNIISSFVNYQNPGIYLVGRINKNNPSLSIFKGIIHYHRLFNYVLPIEDVSKLWNNANPIAYYLPNDKFNRDLGKSLESSIQNQTSRQPQLSNVQPTSESIYWVIAECTVVNKGVDARINELRCVTNTGGLGYDILNKYPIDVASGETVSFVGMCKCDTTRKTLTISINTPDGTGSGLLYDWSLKTTIVGCVGEYLSSNLVGNQDSTASAWINSAQQLAYNDSYKEPLLDNTDPSDLTAKAEPKILYSEEAWYGIEWRISASDPHCTRIGNLELHKTLPIQNKMRGCVLNNTGTVVTYLNPADWTADSTARDGSVGNVMVEIPSHYRKFETIGDVCRCKISEYPLPGYHHVPTMYISAYEATIQRSTLKLASVVNTTEDYRGGVNVVAWDGTYRSLLGVPATGKSKIKFREYARNINEQDPSWNCLDYNVYKAVLWLYYIEYANRNSQDTFIEEKDSNGFSQGGLGAGVTTLNGNKLTTFNNMSPFIPCGYTDTLGNNSGVVKYSLPSEYDPSIKTVEVPRYRGIENPFGHIWKWVDGCKCNIQSDEEGGLSEFFVCNDPSKYQDTDYTDYEKRGELARSSGFIKNIAIGRYGELIPIQIGGSGSTYFCDEFSTNVERLTGQKSVLIGGYATSSTLGGLCNVYVSYGASGFTNFIGTRLCFIPQKK